MIGKFIRCMTAVLCCLPAVSIAASDDPKELERVLAKLRSEPMIFVVATGEPNACGRGCSEWIAGQGQFDESAAQRFREFLAVLAKRDLPIFFNSDGGLLREAVQIGLILRENRMTAGVARTVPEGWCMIPGNAVARGYRPSAPSEVRGHAIPKTARAALLPDQQSSGRCGDAARRSASVQHSGSILLKERDALKGG
jgi:hypothetical protein